MEFILFSSAGFFTGLILLRLIRASMKKKILKEVASEAELIVSEAKEELEAVLDQKARLQQNYLDELTVGFEKKAQKIRQQTMDLTSKIEEIKMNHQELGSEHQSAIDKKTHQIGKLQKTLDPKQEHFQEKKAKVLDLQSKLKDRLKQKANSNVEQIKVNETTKLRNRVQNQTAHWIKQTTEKFSADVEKHARRFLEVALNRFKFPYCAERGTGYLEWSDDRKTDILLKHHLVLEKECGVDLVINKEAKSISVAGFDPVRRQLSYTCIQKVLKMKSVDESKIKNIVQKTKKDLFARIKADGKKIAKRLKLEDLHPEIKNMMGALRYRYSFSQNQYFHCEEVGFLCGLLMSEMGLDTKDGRRAGLLHDIGKAMDHSIEGGHAVIGANFIKKHEEKKAIVHAVRSHHYDETPTSNLAFLVIAADALSGARPGARKMMAMADSYSQKLNQLEEIGNSFSGVEDTLILSAGRELRVFVDSSKISDLKALSMSQEIAKRVEGECVYPGQIKVTVVRRTKAVSFC